MSEKYITADLITRPVDNSSQQIFNSLRNNLDVVVECTGGSYYESRRVEVTLILKDPEGKPVQIAADSDCL